MIKKIILLSGPISSGKSTLAKKLATHNGFFLFKSNEYIDKHARKLLSNRREFQNAGDNLDKKTNGAWIADELVKLQQENDGEELVIVDAVRIQKQIDAIRKAFGSRVLHVHVDAPIHELSERYSRRKGYIKEFKTYSEVKNNRTERNVNKLAKFADIIIDTHRCTEQDVYIRLAGQLGFYGTSYDRNVDVLVGGEYGSEGKGQIAAYLAPEYDILMRVGGPNAGHTVYAEPKPHKFHHLPSGTKSSDAKLILGAGAVINVDGLFDEISKFGVTQDRLVIDPQAMIICPEDIEFEKKKLLKSIASTAQGVGSATSRKILRKGADPSVKLAKNIKELKPFIGESLEVLDKAYAEGKKIMLEGTQGTGLSIHHGKYPYVTSRETSVAGCIAEAGIAPSRVRKIIMTCRTYPIRVGGNSGGMTQELSLEIISQRSGIDLEELKATEITTTTKRKRRIGEFEWDLLRKAASINGPTDIALTFVDYLDKKNRNARRFDQLNPKTILFIEDIERVTKAPVSLISTRFHSRSIIDRRRW